MEERLDGLKIYRWPDDFTDITLNGTSVADLLPEEAAIYPDGYGWVVLGKESADNELNVLIDGSHMQYIKRGLIEII